ncbi:MAG: family 1 glycosylhydrolase [Microthrixaceae bacterium]|nr:family 1 glycosylhydrolase [Microthrixaceae bacterium]
MVFPEGFLWGTGASSTQTEGAPAAGDWAAWEQAGRAPRSGDGNGFATRYAEDAELWRGLGLVHHRLSLPWARIEPRPGRFDQAEVERYRQMLTELADAGILTWACLHHFTVPGWFVDEGGFADERAAGRYWPAWVDRAAQAFGDLIFGWKPINEPVAYATIGWLDGSCPPGRQDFVTFLEVLRLIHLADRDARRELRGAGQPIASVVNLSPVSAVDDSVEAAEWARLVDDVVWGIALRLERDAVLAIPGSEPVEVADPGRREDLVGFSYYSGLAVDGRGVFHPTPQGAAVSPLGYGIWPGGLEAVLERLAEELPGRRLLVSELGLGTTDDRERVRYLAETLRIVESALSGGIDVAGVFLWCGVDNYEWTHGWSVPFGVIDRERRPKPSARLVADTIRDGRVPRDVEPYLEPDAAPS